MARRFRYFVLPAEAVSSSDQALVIRLDAGDYEVYESVWDGRWVPDNAAYEYVHGRPEIREVDRAEAHDLLSQQLGRDRADVLVP
jgi:hypothetical protein